MNFRFLIIFVFPVIFVMSPVVFAQALLSDSQVNAEIEAAIQATPLPTQIDQLTSLVSMQTFGVRGLQYNYKLAMKGSDLGGEAQLKLVKTTVRNQAKTTCVLIP